jgi:hypothetical protein
MTNSWIDDLPELPDLPTGEERQAIFIPKRDEIVISKSYLTEEYLLELSRPNRSKCMNCEKMPRVAAHWANGHGMAWFCIPHFMEWAKEDDRDIVGVWYLEDGEMPKPSSAIKKNPKGVDKVRKLGEDITIQEIEKRLKQRHYGPGPHPGTGTEQTVHAGNGAAAGVDSDEWKSLYTDGVIQAAIAIREESVVREPALTGLMKSLAEKYDARMIGLKDRLKTEESLARKIDKWITETGLPVEDAMREAVYDAVRYTMVFENENYVRNAKRVQEELAREGWVQYDNLWKNYFTAGDDYDGYNTVYVNEAGERFELQFHTPETSKRQKIGWPMYAEWRAEVDESKRADLWSRMVDLWIDYEKPNGWENLKGIKK